jgi:hypothetical protein
MDPTATHAPQNATSSRPPPVCSSVSLALPLIGGVLGYAIVVGKPPGDAGWPNVVFGPLVLPASAFCGIVLSGISFVRRERHALVSWLAVVLNIVLLVYGIARLR